MLLPETFRAYDIASVIILGPTRCISEARQQSHMNENLRYPFCPLHPHKAWSVTGIFYTGEIGIPWGG